MGVVANKKFMMFYFCFICGSAILCTAAYSMEYVAKQHENSDMGYKLLVADRVFLAMDTLVTLSLHIMMLVVFERYGSAKQQQSKVIAS